MRQHLYELCQGHSPANPQAVELELVDLMTDIAGRLRDESYLSQHLHTINTLKQCVYLRIHLASSAVDADNQDQT